MKVVFILLAFAIHFLTIYLILFCFDNPEIKVFFPLKIKKPTIYDLNFIKNAEDRFFKECDGKITYELYELVSHNFEQIESYSQNIIASSHEYFSLRNDIDNSESSFNEGFSKTILFIFTYILVFLSAQKFFNVSVVIIILITLLLCLLGDFIIYKIYRLKFSIPKFAYDESRLKELFSTYYDESYDISSEIAYNNYLLEKHYIYLLSIKEKVVFRTSLRKILVALAVVIYALFFWQISQ